MLRQNNLKFLHRKMKSLEGDGFPHVKIEDLFSHDIFIFCL